MGRLCRAFIAATVLAAAASASGAFAQSSRQIKFIVPFPAGGGGDVLTRMVAEK